jgi:ABC-type nitrate/sulfonate/bicarbonate transport system substrate-binding protein
MLRRCALGALAAGVAVLVAASATTAQTPALTTIRFIGAPGDDLVGFWYAQSTGMFAKAGLNVVVDKASSGAVVSQAIVGGADDIGRTSLNSLIAAHVHNVPFVLIAPAAIHEKKRSVNSGVLVAANSPFKSILDLQGKTVSSTELGSLGSLGVRAMIDEQGGDSSTVHFVELPTTAIAAAIEQNRIDAGVSNEPVMTRDLEGGKVRVLADMLEGYPGVTLEGAYFAMHDWATANQDAVQRFQRVLRQATIYANAHVTELLPLLIANSGLEPDVAAKMHHALMGVDFNPSQVQPVIDICAKYKVIPHGFDAREMFLTARR